MTKKEKEALFNEKFFKWHQHLMEQQSTYCENAHLSYEKRLELEKKIADLVDFCNENGLYMHEPNDIAQFMIQLEGNGSKKISQHGFSFCTRESCYTSVHLDETPAEIHEHAKMLAQADVDAAVRQEREEIEKKKQEEADRVEYERRYAEACKRNKEVLEELSLAEELEELRALHAEHADEIKRAKKFSKSAEDDAKRQEKAAKSYARKTDEERKAEKIKELQEASAQQARELDALLAAREEKDRKFLEEHAPATNALIEKADEALAEAAERDRMAKLADMVYETLHGEKSPDAIADKLIEQVNAYANLKDYDALSDFDFSMCTHEEIEAVDEYILQCQRFTDAQNSGLTGLGLYTFNNDRMDAHEKMLEAWGLDSDMVALSATKGFDYCSDWNHKTHQYDARPQQEAELMLCWVLWKCRNIKKED